MDGNVDGVVLLIGSGWQTYREYLLQGLAQQVALWLIDEEPPTWQLPYITGSTVAGTLDGFPDRQGLIGAALGVAQDQKVLGVLTYDELFVTATAEIAERLGVRGLTTAGAENCRDKNRSRATLTAARLPQPSYSLADGLDAAAAAAADIGYPVVLKPRGMGASAGVVRAERRDDLLEAFAVTERAVRAGPPAYGTGVLIEELVDGPEISVDGAVSGGSYQPFCLAHKQLGHPPYFEEVGHVVDSGDPLLDDAELLGVLAEAHRALGVPDGVTHTEVRLTTRGPVIIEVNARLGGDLIPYLGKLATGVDPGRVAADVAIGVRPDVKATIDACAGIRFVYPPRDCRVLSVSVPEAAAVAGLIEARAIVQPGAALRLPPSAYLSRYAFVIAVAPTAAACETALDEAASLVELRYEPLDDSEPYEGRPW